MLLAVPTRRKRSPQLAISLARRKGRQGEDCRGSGLWIWAAKARSRSGVSGLGFRVWGLGFRV